MRRTHTVPEPVLVLGLAALLACTTTDPEAAFLAGDFLEAREHYNADDCNELSEGEAKICHERAEQITEALAGAAQYLGRRANESIRHKKQIQFNRYSEAIRCLELALEIMPADDPSRPEFEAGIARIRETVASMEQELDAQLARLREMLETGTYDPDVWTDIRLTFERVRVLLLAISRQDDRPRALAKEFVEKFRRHGQFEHARIATQLADAVVAANRSERQHSDRELIVFGIIDHMAQKQEATRTAKIDELVTEVDAALVKGKDTVAAEKAHAALELGPTGRTKRRLRAIIDRLDGASGQAKRAREARRTVAPASTDIAPVRLVKQVFTALSGDDGDGDEETSSGEDAAGQPAPHRTFEERLRDAVRLYEQKNVYEAVASLEQLHRERRSRSERRKVAKLRRVWEPDRKRLVTELVKEADRLFVLMDERSLAEYKRAQGLSPEGAVAEHIAERIETLERILRE